MSGGMFLCLQCGKEFPKGYYSACPGCGDSKGVPADTDDKVTVTLTRHELRILTIWAERWATQADKSEDEREHMRRVLYGIADRMEMQSLSRVPLTLAGEITELKRAYPGTETNFPEPPDPPEKKT